MMEREVKCKWCIHSIRITYKEICWDSKDEDHSEWPIFTKEFYCNHEKLKGHNVSSSVNYFVMGCELFEEKKKE